MRRRRKNPITSSQVLLVGLGAVGGAVAYHWYTTQQAAALATAQANSTYANANPNYTSLPAPATSTQSGSQGVPNATGPAPGSGQ